MASELHVPRCCHLLTLLCCHTTQHAHGTLFHAQSVLQACTLLRAQSVLQVCSCLCEFNSLVCTEPTTHVYACKPFAPAHRFSVHIAVVYTQDAGSIGGSQLRQSLRQLSRAVMVALPAIGLSLEVCMRSLEHTCVRTHIHSRMHTQMQTEAGALPLAHTHNRTLSHKQKYHLIHTHPHTSGSFVHSIHTRVEHVKRCFQASLRNMGLRDAGEAARAASCCLHLAAMQLPPRCVCVCVCVCVSVACKHAIT